MYIILDLLIHCYILPGLKIFSTNQIHLTENRNPAAKPDNCKHLSFSSLYITAYSPKEVSAVNECLVPLLDSKTKPGRSSFKIVACWPSELWIAISPSFRQVRDQFPTVSLAGPGADKIGWLVVDGFTWLRARCNFSKNSLRLSI